MPSTSRYQWSLALAASAAVSLAAFWILLGTNFSPEMYWALPTAPGNLEIIWMCLATAATVLLLRSAARHPDECHRWFNAALPTSAAAVFILAKHLFGFHSHVIDPILFCTACGWTITLCWRDPAPSNRSGLLAFVVVSAAIGLTVYYVIQQIRYFNSFQLGYADCGDYARTMFNSLYNPRELFLRVNPDRPLFYDHLQPGFLPFVPLWFLWPGIPITILLQVLAVTSCAIPIYWIGQKLLQDKAAALLLALTWLVFPPASQFIYSGSYGFHCGTLCLPLCFLAVALWLDNRPGGALLFAAWAILLKEEAAIPIGTFGLYLALFGGRRRLGLVMSGIAFAYFLLVTALIIPAITHQPYMALSHFPGMGRSHSTLLLSPVANPRVFWGNLLAPSTLYFAVLLLAPLLFVPLRKPSILFIGSLVFVFDCLNPTLKSIRYWYQLALFPVVFWALAAALSRATRERQRAVLSATTTAGILLSLFFGNTFWSKTTTVPLPPLPDRPRIVQRMAHKIDPQTSLFATQRVAAHFVTQKYLYVYPPVPQDIDYVLLDMRDLWRATGNLNRLKSIRATQRQAEALPQLRLIDAEDGVLLYARHGESIEPRRLVERDVLPTNVIRQSAELGKGVTFEGYTIATLPSDDTDHDRILVTMFSSVAAPVDVDLAVRCHVELEHATSPAPPIASTRFQPLGQSIWPINHWLPGKYYADEFRIDLPAGSVASGLSISFECQSL
ncbi:MAG TPA: DUF2079 domain-containing protein [Verrucomicrobiae bacterium]|nr:DUF2079 domain-containing protein [Verrucomicrobiae bacterium]